MKRLKSGKAAQHAAQHATQRKVRSRVFATPKTLAVTVAVATALIAQLSVVSNASWTDQEWNHAATLGTQDCLDPEGPFASRGQGRALSGSLLGIDLDNIVAANGVKVTQRDAETTVFPNGANPAPQSPAFADPLNVGLLGNAIKLDLGNGMLQLPLNNDTGVLGQFGAAYPSGLAQGAAGYITESGAIGTEPGSGYPELATLKLSDLIDSIDPGIAQTLGDVSDIALEVGAVTGRATLDGCDATWHGVTPVQRTSTGEVESGNLEREYLTSAADLSLKSPTISALHTEVLNVVNGLQPKVNALVSDKGLLTSITGPLVTSLTNILAGPNGSGLLRIDGTQITIAAAVNTNSLMSLLSAPLTDSQGVVTIDLASGGLSVDLAALVGVAYPAHSGDGLNGLAPNTNLLDDPNILAALTAAITSALSDWVAIVESALSATIDAIEIVVDLRVKLSVNVGTLLENWIEIGAVEATVSGSLLELLSNQGEVSASLVLLSGLANIPILGPILVGLLNGILKPVLDLVTLTVKNTLGGIVGSALTGVFDLLKVLPESVATATSLLLTTLSSLHHTLFLPSVVSLTVNAQNAPFTGSQEPSDWAATAAHGIPTGRYDVAALRISVLEGLAGGVVLYLGRGSVGPGCSPSSAHTVGCADY